MPMVGLTTPSVGLTTALTCRVEHTPGGRHGGTATERGGPRPGWRPAEPSRLRRNATGIAGEASPATTLPTVVTRAQVRVADRLLDGSPASTEVRRSARSPLTSPGLSSHSWPGPGSRPDHRNRIVPLARPCHSAACGRTTNLRRLRPEGCGIRSWGASQCLTAPTATCSSRSMADFVSVETAADSRCLSRAARVLKARVRTTRLAPPRSHPQTGSWIESGDRHQPEPSEAVAAIRAGRR